MEFADVGGKCTFAGCNLTDFLPFECDCCHNLYCLEHRQYNHHSCRDFDKEKDHRVIDCPLCGSSIRLETGVDPNLSWSKHESVCDSTNSKNGKRIRKPKCPVLGCKERLTTSNNHHCTKCRQNICIKHRLQLDHNCPGRAVKGVGAMKYLNKATHSKKSVSSSSSYSTSSLASFGASIKNSFNSATSDIMKALKDSAHRRGAPRAPVPVTSSSLPIPTKSKPDTKPRLKSSNLKNNAASIIPPPSTTVTATSSRSREACPYCSIRFGDVLELVAHVERNHPHSNSGSSSSITDNTTREASATGKSKWNCSACTFENSASSGICEICGTAISRAAVTPPKDTADASIWDLRKPMFS